MKVWLGVAAEAFRDSPLPWIGPNGPQHSPAPPAAAVVRACRGEDRTGLSEGEGVKGEPLCLPLINCHERN